MNRYYYVDFSGFTTISAETEEEAQNKFFTLIEYLNRVSHDSKLLVEIDDVKEV